MSELDLYLRLAVALGIGLGVGIERGWKQRQEAEGERATGVRTFALVALVGAAGGLMTGPAGSWPLVGLTLGVSAFVVTLYLVSMREPHADRGATTETAFLLTFLVGALAGLGELLAAGIIGALMIALLDLKTPLHAALQKIKEFELTAALKLLLIAVILLPVMPDRGYGPGAVLNPHNLLWAVVIIDTLGLIGYAAIRFAGPERGALLLGFVGGFMSSTGVTLAAAQAARARPDAAPLLATSVSAAQAVMFVRTMLLVAALNADLLSGLAIPALTGAVTAAIVAAILFMRSGPNLESRDVPFGSPDQLLTALEFVAVVIIALLAGHYARLFGGDVGVVASALLAGAVDVDAATVSLTTISGAAVETTSLDQGMAIMAIVLALAANSIVKTVIAYVRGNAALAMRAAPALLGSALAAIAALALQAIWS